jgi:two-component system, OmpR family, phosphate regulon sensor histidine kinase PhoR
LSRIEMKAHMRPNSRLDLAEILNHVIDSLTPLADENDVVINADISASFMPALGDRDELVQVFSNLIENAIKYGMTGGKVDIHAGGEGGEPGRPHFWAVSVHDYGPGIAAEHLPRLTERFYRADIDSSRQKQGTGLGLAIVKHILTRHRGRLSIESELGAGATFTVRFKAESAAPDAGDPPRRSNDAMTRSPPETSSWPHGSQNKAV